MVVTLGHIVLAVSRLVKAIKLFTAVVVLAIETTQYVLFVFSVNLLPFSNYPRTRLAHSLSYKGYIENLFLNSDRINFFHVDLNAQKTYLKNQAFQNIHNFHDEVHDDNKTSMHPTSFDVVFNRIQSAF